MMFHRRSGDIICAVDALSNLLGDRLSKSMSVREQHGAGEGLRDVGIPDAVAFAGSTEDVSAILGICAAHGVAVIPRGAGTSLEGHLMAAPGSISLDLSRMDRVLQVNETDLDCRVEAGVTREALNSHLRATGLFFPVDPGANATIGGMAATRASGTNAVRYGTMRDVVLGLKVVTPQGVVIRTGGRARKSSAGYDLTGLYVGSEGTLGIITELQLRLFGIPETIAAATCQFGSIADAAAAATSTVQMGIPVARVELMDALQVQASISFSNLSGLAAKPTLFFEFHGTPGSVGEQVELVREIVAENGGSNFGWSNSSEGRAALWKARHEAYFAARALKSGAETFSTDACVPIGELARVIEQAQELARKSGLLCPIVGHVGDGNFHVFIIHDAAERGAADKLAKDIARLALNAGGTCTGEHGIGRHKLDLLVEEHGEEAVDVMRSLKQCFDPQNILNPGSTIPS